MAYQGQAVWGAGGGLMHSHVSCGPVGGMARNAPDRVDIITPHGQEGTRREAEPHSRPTTDWPHGPSLMVPLLALCFYPWAHFPPQQTPQSFLKGRPWDSLWVSCLGFLLLKMGLRKSCRLGEGISKAVWGQRRVCIWVGKILFLRSRRRAPAHARSHTGPAHGFWLLKRSWQLAF